MFHTHRAGADSSRRAARLRRQASELHDTRMALDSAGKLLYMAERYAWRLADDLDDLQEDVADAESIYQIGNATILRYLGMAINLLEKVHSLTTRAGDDV